MKPIDFIKNRKNSIYIILSAVIIIACLWAFLSASVLTGSLKSKIKNSTYQNKEANIENLLVTETKDGQKLWQLFAESGNYTDMDNIVLLNGIIGNFYEDNRINASFKSGSGTYNNVTKEIILYDKILLVSKDGTMINADRIKYTGKGEDIVATGNVEIEKPGEGVVMGNKAVLKGNYQDFHIEGRTKTKFYM